MSWFHPTHSHYYLFTFFCNPSRLIILWNPLTDCLCLQWLSLVWFHCASLVLITLPLSTVWLINIIISWTTTTIAELTCYSLRDVVVVNSLWPSDDIWQYRSGSPVAQSNGLLSDGIKPLPEPMLISHQWASMAFPWECFHNKCPSYFSI